MSGAFEIVVVVVAAIGGLGAIAALSSSRRGWEEYGRGLSLDSDARTGGRTAPEEPAADAERDLEIGQLLAAREARRRRRAAAPGARKAGFAQLAADDRPAPVDAALRAEIRELIGARNHRRARRGRPPLDVDAELTREIGRLTGRASG